MRCPHKALLATQSISTGKADHRATPAQTLRKPGMRKWLSTDFWREGKAGSRYKEKDALRKHLSDLLARSAGLELQLICQAPSMCKVLGLIPQS